MAEVRVLVVDDHEPFRRALESMLTQIPGFVAVAAVGSAEAALAAVASERPDLVLMDVNLPGMSGVEATRRIRSRPDAPVVALLSTYDEDEVDHDGCGAAAYLTKVGLCPQRIVELWASARGTG